MRLEIIRILKYMLVCTKDILQSWVVCFMISGLVQCSVAKVANAYAKSHYKSPGQRHNTHLHIHSGVLVICILRKEEGFPEEIE